VRSLLAVCAFVLSASACAEPAATSPSVRPVSTTAAPAQTGGRPAEPAPPASASAAPAPAGRVVEVWRIDDAVDPIRSVKDSDVPDGIELRVETVPAGDPNRPVKVTYGFTRLSAAETPEAAVQRLKAFGASVSKPFGTQFVVGPVVSEADAGPTNVTGFRTYLAREPAVFDDRAVSEAHVELADRPVVRITVGAEGGARFEQATKEWTARRIAIVAFGQVVAAPLVMAPITSKKASIPAQGPTDDARRAWAERLVSALTGR
jgi:hypothetical protein